MQLFDRFPARYLVPNAITCVSIVIGLRSIQVSLTARSADELISAAWMILYAVLLDKVDGAVARRLKASSELGVQLDSFSDFVTFGIAPGALVAGAMAVLVPDPFASGPYRIVPPILSALYVVSAALRLAKFNVTTTTIHPRFFLGLPSTSSGGLIASAFLAHRELGLSDRLLPTMLVALVINAGLMVSNLPQPKMHISRVVPLRVLQGLVIASVYILIPLHMVPTYLVGVASLYTLGGFVYGVVFLKREGSLRT